MLKSFLLLSCILTVAEASTDAPWLVGTGIADCTGPAAEVVMMGYGDSEHKTAGIHMRLYARAFIFVDPASHDRVAFVNVDTWAATEAVIQGVERKLHAWFQGQHYSRENLIVAGSHTHHGPAGASSYMLFQFSSAGRVHQSLDALVDGIAEAVWLAHHNIKPANVFFGNGMVDNSTVPNCPMPNCANRQRSPSSFMHNPEVERRKFFGEDNADRNMDLLKIVNAETGKPMGMVNWFGVHPTSLNSDYNLISGDNKGYASYAFEQDMNGPSWVQRAGRGPFVAAFAQGVSGDISPNLLGAWCTNSGEKCDNQWSVCWSNGQHKNSLCLGQGPGRDKYESMKILGSRQKTAAKTIFNRTTTPVGTGVDHVLRFADLSKYWVDRDGNGTWVQTCEPCLGTSFAAGTTDGPTGMDEFGQNMTPSNGFMQFFAHMLTLPSAEDKRCQAPKNILLRPNTVRETVFPKVLGFQLVRIGQMVVAAVPGEFTTMAGARTKEAIKKILVDGGVIEETGTVVLNNVASGYAGYVTTYEEYQHQRYEGGFTTYGPYTHEAMTNILVQMAEDMADGKKNYPGARPQLTRKDQDWENIDRVLVDDPPIGGQFGDVKEDVHPGPHWPGDTVRCTLWGAHPRNHLQRNSSFGTVWRWQPNNASDVSAGGSWVFTADDSDFDTMFSWRREGISASLVTISWTVPDGVPGGWYTIHYSGHARKGGVTRIHGACGVFEVQNAEAMMPFKPDELVIPPPPEIDTPDMPLEEVEMLKENAQPVKLVSTEQLMEEADAGAWSSVCYHLAREKRHSGAVTLRRHFLAKDPRAQQALRRATGARLALLPYDLCVAFTKTGRKLHDLNVEHPRWLNPKPSKDQRFLQAGDAECSRCRREEKPTCHGHLRGKKLPDGWYSVVQYPLGDSPHHLRKALVRRKDWRMKDLELQERFYVIWHVQWEAVQGESFELLSDAERKFEQLREVYKALQRSLAVTGLLVDASYRERRFLGVREDGIMKKFREWWQQQQTAAVLARDVGETLLCKAAKAQQWDLVVWMLRSEEDPLAGLGLADQLEGEWEGLWDEQLWYAQLQSTQDLRSLLEQLDSKATLLRPWLRGGAVAVPAQAQLLYPKLEMLKEAVLLEPLSASLALEALRRVGCSQLCFALPTSRASTWVSDLRQLAEGEETFGRPLLHRAAAAGALELVEALLEVEADPDGRTDRSALAVAASAQQWEVCNLLLEHGCGTTGPSGDFAFRAAQRASCELERSHEITQKEVARAKLAMEVLDRLYTRRERPRAKSLAEFFTKQVKGEVVNGLEPRPFKLEQGMLKHASLTVWSRGLIVGCGLGGAASSDFDWKEPRSLLFAVLEPEAFEAALKEEALDVGRGLALLPEEQLMGSHVKALAVSVPMRRLAPAAPPRKVTGDAASTLERQASLTTRKKRGRMAEAQTVQPESLGGQRFRSMLPVLAWAPPTGTLRVESATSCCHVAIGRVDVLADGIRLGETVVNEGLAELEVLVPPRELEAAFQMSGRPLMQLKLDFRPGEERNVSEEIQVKVPVGVYIYMTPIILEDSKLQPEMMVFVCAHRRDIPDDGQPFKGLARWHGGEVRLDAWRPVELGADECLQLLSSMRFEPDLGPGRAWSPVEWEDTSTEDCKACQFQRLITPVRVGNIVNAS